MTKFLKYLFSSLLLINISIFAQEVNKNIATVGNEKISEREFKIRYELVPHYSRDQFNEDSSKQDLLYSIIAEKLLAQQANRLGYDTTDYFKYSINQIKDLYVRDALYKKEIDSKVNISQKDIQTALNRFSKSLQVKVVSASDSSTIFSYYSKLKNGAPFDSIEKISDPIEYDSNKIPIKINYGQMEDDKVEDTLYSLKMRKFSSPVKTNGGWFIFKLVDASYNVPPNANDPDYNKSILNVIRLRKSRIIGIKYLDNFYKDKKARVDSTLFLSLAQKVSSLLTEKKNNNDYGREGYLFLTEGNLMTLISEFGKGANKDLVHIKKNPISLKEYLYSLIVYPFLIKNPSFESTAYGLMGSINKYIQYKFLTEEGFKQGFQNLPDVKEDINIWRDDYLAKMLKNTFRDSVNVSDEELKNYYEESKEFEQVNILEILNSNLEVIETVFNELKAGENFRDLAREYTQRTWTKNKGGEFGYFPVTAFGEIGKIAAKLKLNQVYGPVKTDSGYSVIKLIGRKFDKTKTPENFDSVKTQLRYSLLGKKFDEKFFKYIAKLSEKYKYSINEKALKDLKVLDIPMFTFKYIGFGGRIAAIPFLGPWYNWTKYLKNKSAVLP
jgi:peptidyl-prolyl cis-trans isomerase C